MGTVAGIAYFDNPSIVSGGWFSIDGSRAARFSNIAELDPVVLWITNASYQDYSANELRNVVHLRNSGFFRQSLPSLVKELDISSGTDDEKDISDVISALSVVASRVIDLTEISFPGIRFGNTLYDSIYEMFGFSEARDPSAQFQLQIQSAFQENSIVTGQPWPMGSEKVTLVPNRVSYAETLLSYPVPNPAGGLREFNTPMSVEEFLDLDHPALAQVDVDLTCAEDPELLAYGVQISGTAIQREWIAQPEANFLYANGARITIHRTIRAQSSAMLPPLPEKLTDNAFVRCSYSGGIVAEAIVFALMSKRYGAIAATKSRGAKTRYFFPVRAAYLRSVDRMLSFAVAKRLSDTGLRVKRYSYGSVEINATREEVPEVMNIGADMGFMLLAVNTIGKDG